MHVRLQAWLRRLRRQLQPVHEGDLQRRAHQHMVHLLSNWNIYQCERRNVCFVVRK
jgi:hypothetical protein